MKIEDVLNQKSFADVVAELKTNGYDENTDKWIEQYSGEHAIMKKQDRKVTYKIKDENGVESDKTENVPLVKLPVTFQEHVVRFASSMLFGKQVKYNLKNKKTGLLGSKNKFDDPMEIFSDTIYDNKMAYFDRKLARRLMSECRAVEYWYVRPSDKKIHSQLWCKTLGSLVYPYYDEYGDLVAISREYTTKTKDKAVKHFDIYTAQNTIKNIEIDGTWNQEIEKNPYGKITAVYYEFGEPVWSNVQPEIDRYEDAISRLCDSNDYSAYPSILAKVKSESDIVNVPRKGSVGDIFILKAALDSEQNPNWGDLSYLETQNSVDSIKLELETLEKIIYGKTATVDLSFSNVKGLATNLSGIAIDLMFMDARLQAMAHEEVFGSGQRRRVSILKTLLGFTNQKYRKLYEEMNIVPEFQNPLPTDVATLIELLSLATGGKQFMSRESAIDRNVLLTDVDTQEELERIHGEPVEQLGGSVEL